MVDNDAIATPLRDLTMLPAGADIAISEWDSLWETIWIAPHHIHHEDDEIWYVLEGEMILHLDGEDIHLRPGDCGMAVRGVAHSYRNVGPGALRYILVTTRQVVDLITTIHTVSRDSAALEAHFQEYGSTYLGWLAAPG